MPSVRRRSPKTADARAPARAGREERRRAESSAASAFPAAAGLRTRGRHWVRGAAGVSALSLGTHETIADALVQHAQQALRDGDRARACGAPRCREGRPGDGVLGSSTLELVTKGMRRLQDDRHLRSRERTEGQEVIGLGAGSLEGKVAVRDRRKKANAHIIRRRDWKVYERFLGLNALCIHLNKSFADKSDANLFEKIYNKN